MSEEQTAETVWFAVDNIAPTRWPADEVASACLGALDIDPEMTVARLREDLAIAARVRGCVAVRSCVYEDATDDAPGHYDAATLLAFLRGETP